MKIEFIYYKFQNPGFALNDWEYPKAKKIADSGRKVDFYGISSIFKTAKPFLIILFFPILLVILVNLKAKYLTPDGTASSLDFLNIVLFIAIMATAVPLTSLAIIYGRAKFYDKKMNALLKRSLNYQDFQNRFYNKKLF